MKPNLPNPQAFSKGMTAIPLAVRRTPSANPFRPTWSHSLLYKSLLTMNDNFARHEEEVMQGNINSREARSIASYISLVACRLEFIKALSFEAIQGFKHAPHIMRHDVKRAYRKVMDDIRRYDGFTVSIFRESVDYYDQLTDHFNATLRNITDIIRMDIYLLFKEAAELTGRTPTPGQLHLLADLFLARSLMDVLFPYAEKECEDLLRQKGVSVDFMLDYYPVRLHSHPAELYRLTADRLAGDLSTEKLIAGPAHDKAETDITLLINKLTDLRFGDRMVEEIHGLCPIRQDGQGQQ